MHGSVRLSKWWLVVLLAQPCCAEDLARTAIEGNSAATGAIHAYYCKVRYSTQSNQISNELIADYWRTSELIRIREKTGLALNDLLIRAGKIEATAAQPVTPDGSGRRRVATVIDEKNTHVSDADAWQLSLMDLPVMVRRTPAYRRYDLAGAARAGRVRDVEWTTIAERKLVRLAIDIPEERRTYEVSVDPALNWLITECRHRVADEAGADFWDLRFQIGQTREIKPSIFVPTKTTFSFRMQGKLFLEGVATFEDIVVNDGLPPVPPMALPGARSLVVDKVEGTVQSVDAKGRRVGRVARLGEPMSASTMLPEASPSPGPTIRFVAGLSLAILAACFGIAAIRHRLRQSVQA